MNTNKNKNEANMQVQNMVYGRATVEIVAQEAHPRHKADVLIGPGPVPGLVWVRVEIFSCVWCPAYGKWSVTFASSGASTVLYPEQIRNMERTA